MPTGSALIELPLWANAALYVIAHAIAKSALFMTAGTVTEACKILRDHGAREVRLRVHRR